MHSIFTKHDNGFLQVVWVKCFNEHYIIVASLIYRVAVIPPRKLGGRLGGGGEGWGGGQGLKNLS
jgi:hypothetical protein